MRATALCSLRVINRCIVTTPRRRSAQLTMLPHTMRWVIISDRISPGVCPISSGEPVLPAPPFSLGANLVLPDQLVDRALQPVLIDLGADRSFT